MSSEEIFEKVKGIIVEQLGATEASVTMEASFIDDGIHQKQLQLAKFRS